MEETPGCVIELRVKRVCYEETACDPLQSERTYFEAGLGNCLVLGFEIEPIIRKTEVLIIARTIIFARYGERPSPVILPEATFVSQLLFSSFSFVCKIIAFSVRLPVAENVPASSSGAFSACSGD